MKKLIAFKARRVLAGALVAVPIATFALPGAHGPNGEHLDGPAQQATSTAPRLEAKSELFEMVATLSGGELSILVDRFDTNEPVLNAKVEVESGPLKAVAKFHSDYGDYSVDDAAFLKVLSTPGEHPLVFTIAAGTQSDLLEGTLKTTAAVATDDHAHALVKWGVGAAIGALLLAAGAFAWRRRRTFPQGGAA
jgi:hypothetical protein